MSGDGLSTQHPPAGVSSVSCIHGESAFHLTTSLGIYEKGEEKIKLSLSQYAFLLNTHLCWL